MEFKHIPREKNKTADRLANQAIDRAAREKAVDFGQSTNFQILSSKTLE